MNIAELVTELRKAPKGVPVAIEYPNGQLHGTSRLISYRGYYDQLAIEPGPIGRTARKLAKKLERAIGTEFTGYKGGEFEMFPSTEVWIDHYGECNQWLTSEVVHADDIVKIKTIHHKGY